MTVLARGQEHQNILVPVSLLCPKGTSVPEAVYDFKTETERGHQDT